MKTKLNDFYNNKFIKKIIRNYLTTFIYVFIIFSSMLPNQNNYTNLKELNTIIPGIDKTFSNDETVTIPKYSLKILEILQNIF